MPKDIRKKTVKDSPMASPKGRQSHSQAKSANRPRSKSSDSFHKDAKKIKMDPGRSSVRGSPRSSIGSTIQNLHAYKMKLSSTAAKASKGDRNQGLGLAEIIIPEDDPDAELDSSSTKYTKQSIKELLKSYISQEANSESSMEELMKASKSSVVLPTIIDVLLNNILGSKTWTHKLQSMNVLDHLLRYGTNNIKDLVLERQEELSVLLLHGKDAKDCVKENRLIRDKAKEIFHSLGVDISKFLESDSEMFPEIAKVFEELDWKTAIAKPNINKSALKQEFRKVRSMALTIAEQCQTLHDATDDESKDVALNSFCKIS